MSRRPKVRLAFRVSPAHVKLFERVAKAGKFETLSHWMRDVCIKQAESVERVELTPKGAKR